MMPNEIKEKYYSQTSSGKETNTISFELNLTIMAILYNA